MLLVLTNNSIILLISCLVISSSISLNSLDGFLILSIIAVFCRSVINHLGFFGVVVIRVIFGSIVHEIVVMSQFMHVVFVFFKDCGLILLKVSLFISHNWLEFVSVFFLTPRSIFNSFQLIFSISLNNLN